MAKSKYLDLIPMITGIMCPFLYLLGIKGAFIMEGGIYHPWWHIVLAGFAPIGILLSGPVGFISVLALLVRSRKGFQRNASSVLKFLFLLLLLIMNCCIILPVNYFLHETVNYLLFS
ncbi:MAG: hypothetical protein ACOX6D_04915 [Thermoguttaceae bacterium]|jgi:hypothetical protein